jgi:DNA-binding YbaB/EbfC family protein
MTDDITPAAGAAMPDLGGLMESFQKVQEARAQVYEGQSGGGVVKIRATGELSFESVEIKREVVDPDDVEMLADLVLAALHDLTARMAEAQQEAMGALGGLDIGGLLGGGSEEEA